MFKQNYPHCNDPKTLFLAKEFNQKGKVKNCTSCEKPFIEEMDYKKFAMVALIITIGVVIVGTVIFGQNMVIIMGSAIVGILFGIAQVTTLVPVTDSE